jgi:hypothetical protein
MRVGALLVSVGLAACASPKRDVQTICEAESRSGLSLRASPAKLTAWLDAHVATTDGKALLEALDAAVPSERGPTLRIEAAGRGVASCPLADAYDAAVSDSGRLADLRALCGASSAELAASDDARRMQILKGAVSASPAPETRALLARMNAAPAPQRSAILREEVAAAPWLDGAPTCIAAEILAHAGRPAGPMAPSISTTPGPR